MDNSTTGPGLAAIRKELGITATALGRAMGYRGTQPHSRVFQIEAQHSVSPVMASRYLDALSALRQAKEVVA